PRPGSAPPPRTGRSRRPAPPAPSPPRPASTSCPNGQPFLAPGALPPGPGRCYVRALVGGPTNRSFPPLSVLFALFALIAAPAAASATGSGPVLGVVPPNASTPFAPATSATQGNVSYHNGSVMRTSTVYAIYWLPADSTVSANYESVIDGYFANV